MGIIGLLPFIEKASRRANVSEFSGCTVAIDSYCWLHKGAFACADRLVRGEETDIHIKYCLKYVSMLLSRNIKPILVFDGRHLPAKAMTEAKRRESRDISKKRAAELLSLGQTDEARSYMRRSVDITHSMALQLIKECRNRNVDCIVAPYEADAQLAYLNIKNIAHLVITEDSDLILFGCTKVLFKMDLEGCGVLVETAKLPLVMKCPIERYNFDKFRQMCIMSGCDYLASLPGIGLAKARQFVNATQDPNFANALKKLPGFFNKMNLSVTEEYRENFLKAEATFKHQYVYDPIHRTMLRLNEPDNDDIEEALCCNAGELLDSKTAFQLALGNLDPFSLKKMDDWSPDNRMNNNKSIKTDSWKDTGVSPHPTIWNKNFEQYLTEAQPWTKKIKKTEPIIKTQTRPRAKVVNLVSKYVPETQDQSLSIEALSNMYCCPPASKKLKIDDTLTHLSSQDVVSDHDKALIADSTDLMTSDRSPILENKDRGFLKSLRRHDSDLKKLSNFPRTTIDNNVVESKFFGNSGDTEAIDKKTYTENRRNPFKIHKTEETQDFIENTEDITEVRKPFRNPLIVKPVQNSIELDSQINEIPDTQEIEYMDISGSQKENSLTESVDKESGYFSKERSPILEPSPRRLNGYNNATLSEESFVDNTYPLEDLVTPVDSQSSYGSSPKTSLNQWRSKQTISSSQPIRNSVNNLKKSNCKAPGLKRTNSLPSNQPTLLSRFGFQKRPALKK